MTNAVETRMQLACRRFAPSGAWPRAFGPEAEEEPTSLSRGRDYPKTRGLRPRRTTTTPMGNSNCHRWGKKLDVRQ